MEESERDHNDESKEHEEGKSAQHWGEMDWSERGNLILLVVLYMLQGVPLGLAFGKGRRKFAVCFVWMAPQRQSNAASFFLLSVSHFLCCCC